MRVIFLLIVVIGLPACSMSSGTRSRAGLSIIRANGGTAQAVELHDLADSLLADLAGCLNGQVRGTPRIVVLETSEPVAYAVAPREVYISRGMLQSVPRPEVRAAIAHELGHLMEAGHGLQAVALMGDVESGDPEARADRAAERLLADAGYDPGAMRLLLNRLAEDTSIPESVREDIQHRAGLLQHRGG